MFSVFTIILDCFGAALLAMTGCGPCNDNYSSSLRAVGVAIYRGREEFNILGHHEHLRLLRRFAPFMPIGYAMTEKEWRRSNDRYSYLPSQF